MNNQDKRYQALTQSAVDAIISADSEGRIVGWNHSAEVIFGYSEAEALGQLLTMLMPASFCEAHIAGMARVRSGGKKHIIGKTVEMSGVRKDGHEFPFEMSLAEWQVSGSKFYTAIIRDITRRKQIEAALQFSEEKFFKAFHASPDAIILTRVRDGSLVEINDSFTRISEYTRPEALASTTLKLELWVNLEDRAACLAALQEHQHVRNREYDFRAKSGRIIKALYSGDVIYINGEAHILSIIRDITERKELEQQRDDLIHMMVHDLRNPLASIQISLGVLECKAFTGEQQAVLEIARSSSARMLALINNILDVSRLETKHLPIEQASVNLGELVKAVLVQQSALADENDLQVQNTVPPNLPLIWVDRRVIERVFENVIGNAFKFTPSGGIVRVGAELAAQGYVRVSVYNSGSSISPELSVRLFQKFASGNVMGRGSGLGLAFSRLAIEAHGGRIWAASGEQTVAPGDEGGQPAPTGVTFFFTLPVAIV